MLRDLLTPDWLPGTSLAHLPLQELVDRGIRALVLDVDRTLLPRRQATLPLQAELWLRHARERMPLHLLSNNPSRRRIGAVADSLGLPYTTSAGKPRRAALRKVLNDLDLPPAQVALVGDRLFTDVLVWATAWACSPCWSNRSTPTASPASAIGCKKWSCASPAGWAPS
jgi:uncharacterized protein